MWTDPQSPHQEQQLIKAECRGGAQVGKLLLGGQACRNPVHWGEAGALSCPIAQADAGKEGAWRQDHHLPGILNHLAQGHSRLHAWSSMASTLNSPNNIRNAHLRSRRFSIRASWFHSRYYVLRTSTTYHSHRQRRSYSLLYLLDNTR